MKRLFILLILFCPNLVSGQESNICSQDGKLLIDTSFSINPDRIYDLINIEKFTLPTIYNRLEYPRFASSNSIEGIVIAKIAITINNTISVKIVKTDDKSLSLSVLSAIDTSRLKTELKDFNKPFEFYIPFKFVVLEDAFQKDLKLTNSIIIKSSSGTSYYESISIQKK